MKKNVSTINQRKPIVLQRSEEWIKARLGCVTASRISAVFAKGSARQNYMAQLISERLTGIPSESYTSAPMRRGIEKEAEAREVYILHKFDVVVVECGSIPHPTIANFSASPDGLVNDDGLLEIKCPNTWTHLQFIKTLRPAREYILQMQAQMTCTGRKWCDFVSFDDRLPDDLSFRDVRISFDKEWAAFIEAEVSKFLAELDAEIRLIKGK